jgi:8-oxo-dGTP pyrophosphatase MutT (NUDIX family)
MEKQVSAGIVPYHKEDKEYLLLHYQAGHWDFPKGHVEKQETLEEAALRELYEETGIKEAHVIKGFKERIEYYFKEHDRLIYKEVYFFLALVYEKDVKISHEHIGFGWFKYNEAKNKITYDNSKMVLDKANEFIKMNL